VERGRHRAGKRINASLLCGPVKLKFCHIEKGPALTYSNPSTRSFSAIFGEIHSFLAATLLIVLSAAIGTAAFAEAAEPYRVGPVEQAGTISGRVIAGGATAKVERFIVPKQVDICGGNYRDTSLVSVEAGTLRNVIVYLVEVAAGKPFRAAARKVTINQVGCHFLPYLSVLMNGGELEAVNSDPVLHNIHVYEMMGQTRGTVANVSQPRKGDIMTMSVNLDGGNMLKVECDAHEFMHAFVFVANNPYYALAARDGSFEIANVPPGRYAIRAWHPYLGERSSTIEVEPNGVTTLDFSY
jgi:hypothetical protein